MLAVTIAGGQVAVRERPDPRPGAGEVLVRVMAAGLNGADQAQLTGRYPAPRGVPADIPGLEFAGEVIGLGAGAERFAVGDRVMSIVAGGAQAELAVVHERQGMPVPPGLGWDAAGGFPEAFTTAHDALFTQAGLTVGERLLVTGAAGGVGTAAVQLAVAAGASVVASIRSEAGRAAVETLGATALTPGEAGGHGPYDVVQELVGGSDVSGHVERLSPGGRIVVLAFPPGAACEIDLLSLAMRHGRLQASTLRARPLEEKAATARRVERHVLPLVASGRVGVQVHARYDLRDAASAYEAFAAGGKLGKIEMMP